MIPSILRSCNILQAHLLLSLESLASSLVCWATIWDWTKDTQTSPRVFQRLLAQSPSRPSVGRVGENPGNEVAISPRVASTTCFAVRMWNRWVLSDAISPTRCLEWGTSQSLEGSVKIIIIIKKNDNNKAIRTGLWSLTFAKKSIYSRGNRV